MRFVTLSLFVGICLIVTVLASPLRAGKDSATQSDRLVVPDFGALADEQAFDARGEIFRSYLVPCQELLREFDKSTMPAQAKVNCAFLLGELHSPLACKSLLEQIDLRSTELRLKTRPPDWGEYPAEEALVKIGMPAVVATLQRLKSEDNDTRRHLMCQVLVEVEGKECARVRLANAQAGLKIDEKQRIVKCEQVVDEL